MQDRTIKILLGAIALGLFLNAGALVYQGVVTPAYAASEGEVYVKGGKLDVRITDGDLEVKGKITAKQDSFDKIGVTVYKGDTLDVCDKCSD